MNQPSTELLIERAEINLQRKLEWIGRYDTRIAFIAGVSIAMLGVLATAVSSIKEWSMLSCIPFGMSTLLLFGSLIAIYISQFPRTYSANESLVYFATIAKLKFDQYEKRFRNVSDNEYLDDLICQIHTNSKILARKFSALKASLIFILLAIIPWLISIYQSNIYI